MIKGVDHSKKGRLILERLKKIKRQITNSHGMSDSEKTGLLDAVNSHINELADALNN